ncbi:ABC transporter permease [Pleionea sediminis]|uniref:ABC transporter permease n=1 Tax=Pleionea sediminis TaxID=2569479 RepID=UPI001185C02E|nr:ABC transporter permease [Pleionea sediminis]
MRLVDYWEFSVPVFKRHIPRTLLLTLAIAIGVCSVILLTSLGEGARRFIEQEFSSLGADLLIILPGKKETQGGAPPIYGTTTRDLTLEDVQAIEHISTIDKIAPIIAGTALITFQNRSREVITMGSTPAIFPIRDLTLGEGRALPENSSTQHVPVIVLGSKIKKELFGNQSAVGEWVRAGDYRFRVIGVLEERGESLGLDLRDMAIIPVRSAEMLFNSPALFRVIIQLSQSNSEAYTEQRIRKIIAERHEGKDDISFVSQDSILSAFNSIMLTVTAVVGAIAAISLVVAGVLIMNVTYISVAQRRHEIGLLKALGATGLQVKRIFIGEALLLTTAGSVIGMLLAFSGIEFVRWYWPDFPIAATWWAVISAIVTAFIMGALFSWLPAAKASKLDPILAMRGFS